MARVLLIVPTATYRAPEFLAAAARLSLEVVIASEEPQALADVMGDRFVQLPLAEPERAAALIVDLAERVGLDAIVAVDDGGSLAGSIAAEQLGLVGNPPAAVAATRNKSVMRSRFADAGVAQPAYRLASARAGDAEELARLAEELGYPIVLKPISLAGSRGVIRANDRSEALAAGRRIAAILERLGVAEREPILLESYLDGDEVAVEALARAGVVEVLAIFDKPDPLIGPYFEETLYVTPTHLDPRTQEACREAVTAAAAALGIREGPIHAELRIGADEPHGVAVIELAARTIGGKCASALSFATGKSLEELVLEHALGRADETRERLVPGSSGVMMIPIPNSGRFARADAAAATAVEHVTGVEITVPVGSSVEALPEGDRYLGFIFARAPERDLVEDALRLAHARLGVEVRAPS